VAYICTDCPPAVAWARPGTCCMCGAALRRVAVRR
jgi:hypothetical protein